MGLRNLGRACDAATEWVLRQAEAKTDPITKWALRILAALAVAEVVAQLRMYLAR